jgi:hypothetical protein
MMTFKAIHANGENDHRTSRQMISCCKRPQETRVYKQRHLPHAPGHLSDRTWGLPRLRRV